MAVNLDAASVRDELCEAPDAHDLTEGEAARLAALSDLEIEAVLDAHVDDDFWLAFDDVRRRAITALRERYILLDSAEEGRIEARAEALCNLQGLSPNDEGAWREALAQARDEWLDPTLRAVAYPEEG